ncbi:MAG: hypothetical protein P8X46_13225, partial [Nitrospirales bacterium]
MGSKRTFPLSEIMREEEWKPVTGRSPASFEDRFFPRKAGNELIGVSIHKIVISVKLTQDSITLVPALTIRSHFEVFCPTH